MEQILGLKKDFSVGRLSAILRRCLEGRAYNPTELRIYTDSTDISNIKNKKIDLIYKDLTYTIIGVLYEVYNELGYGYQEKYYQKAIAVLFQDIRLKFKEQVSLPLLFRGKNIGRYAVDFLIEDKIILEIKKDDNFRKSNIEQVYAYLKAFNLRLGIIANFTKSGVRIKRIANIR